MPGCAGCRLPLPRVDRADDDPKLPGTTAASQRQMDQRHVTVPASDQRGEVELARVMAGAAPPEGAATA